MTYAQDRIMRFMDYFFTNGSEAKAVFVQGV